MEITMHKLLNYDWITFIYFPRGETKLFANAV